MIVVSGCFTKSYSMSSRYKGTPAAVRGGGRKMASNGSTVQVTSDNTDGCPCLARGAARLPSMRSKL